MLLLENISILSKSNSFLNMKVKMLTGRSSATHSQNSYILLSNLNVEQPLKALHADIGSQLAGCFGRLWGNFEHRDELEDPRATVVVIAPPRLHGSVS